MRFVAVWLSMLAVLSTTGCSEQPEDPVSPQPENAPQLVIDDCDYHDSRDGSEAITWQVSGSGAGELVLRLLRFENGEETVVADQRFPMPQGAVKGTMNVKADAKSVECNLSLANAAPLRAALPSTPERMKTHIGGVTFKSLPNQINHTEVWLRMHSERDTDTAGLSPWRAQRRFLLESCVDGTVATAVTIELVAKGD